MNRQLIFAIVTVSFLILATTAVILYGRGFRPFFNAGRLDISGTGLLVATSRPDGASVFINGHLSTATDNTINLSPGEYTIKIFKDGYFPWEKKLIVKKEVVTKAEALLFPTAPKLESITNVGVRNPVLDPSQTKIAYAAASQSARKNGIYILDLSTRPILTLQSSSTQVADDTLDVFSDSTFAWSPDGQELIATISARSTSSGSSTTQTSYLLDATRFNQFPSDVTATLTSIGLGFEKEKKEKEDARLNSLPSKLRTLLLNHFGNLEWSIDDSKILYTASKSADLPIVIKPRLIGSDTIAEQRKIEKDSIYAYDIKEDKNFKILAIEEKNQKEFSLNWFPDSKHLVYIHDNKVDILEYDGSNLTTIYAGPFVNGFVFPWPDGSKVVILTNLGNPNIHPNLYTIVLK